MYGCPVDMERFVGKGMPCFENLTTMETPMNLCSSRSIAGWAIGGEVISISLVSMKKRRWSASWLASFPETSTYCRFKDWKTFKCFLTSGFVFSLPFFCLRKRVTVGLKRLKDWTWHYKARKIKEKFSLISNLTETSRILSYNTLN